MAKPEPQPRTSDSQTSALIFTLDLVTSYFSPSPFYTNSRNYHTTPIADGKTEERKGQLLTCMAQELGLEGKTDNLASTVPHSGKFLREKNKVLPQKAGS